MLVPRHRGRESGGWRSQRQVECIMAWCLVARARRHVVSNGSGGRRACGPSSVAKGAPTASARRSEREGEGEGWRATGRADGGPESRVSE
eukprot:scaffold291929_cov28-Tisochrysis_lutea.AAC.3